MKKIFFTLLAVFVCCNINAQTVTIEYQSYTLTARVTSNNPPECSIACGTSPATQTTLEIPNSVDINGTDYIVTSIARNGFQMETNFIGALILPNQIKRIEQSAFEGCSGFTGNLVLSESVEYLGNKAFKNCNGITSITILGENIDGHNNCLTGMTGVETIISNTDTNNLPQGIQNIITNVENNGGTIIQPEEGETTLPMFYGGDASAPNSWFNTNNWSTGTLPSGEQNVILVGNLTISSEEKVEINYITNAGSIITIKEGGQLVHNNGVLNDVRIEKSINGYNEIDNKDGWYIISSPMSNEISNDNYNNLLDENGDYDLYYYDEENYLWHNYKQGSFTQFNLGQGYLYAKKNSTTIVSVGSPNINDVSFTLSAASELTPSGKDLNGFNLIGNPFTFDICKGDGCAISNDFLKEGYYSLSTNGTWIAKNDSEPIRVCEGILVETKDSSANGESLIISKIPYKQTRNSATDDVTIKVSNGIYEDVALINFNNENDGGLRKIAHLNDDAQMIYFPKDGVNYAITNVRSDVRRIPVSFKSPNAGKYTISIDLKKHKHGNVYLIDNNTGEKIDISNSDYTFLTTTSNKEKHFTLVLNSNSDDNFLYISNNNIIIDDIKGAGKIYIYDVTGRLILEDNANTSACISTESIKKGFYVVHLIDSSGAKTQKISIQ